MRDLRENLPLARNTVGHDTIERRDAVAGYKKKVIPQVKDLADFTALEFLEPGQVDLEQFGHAWMMPGPSKISNFKFQYPPATASLTP